MNLLQQLEAEQMSSLRAKALPDFRPGDTLKVNVKVVDVTYDEKAKQNKTRERIQAFEGVCIARQGSGLNEAFTVRKLSYGEGVERVFPIYSPLVDSVVVVRKGKEETKTVRLGRLEDTPQQASVKRDAVPDDKSVVQKALGLNLANMSDDLRKKYKIKDSVKGGVVITGVDQGSNAAEKRLSAGDVVVEIAQEAVANADDVQKKVDKLKKDGRKTALLLVANAEGELRFVALSLQ